MALASAVRSTTRRALLGVAAIVVVLGALVGGASFAAAATPGAPATGSVCAVADCPYHGPTTSVSFSSQTPKAIAHAPAPGAGYWLVASDGGIFNYGDAAFDGSTGGTPLNKPIVGMASTPDGGGYWLVASDGGIFNYGDASFYGSTGGTPLNKPIVGMASTPSGHGYWLVASDGGIFNYGDAAFYGSAGGTPLNKPIVGMASTPSGHGYWLVASDGGIFNYGDAAFYGSAGGTPLNKPIVGMASTPSGHGYWLVASDGGIFNYGDAAFYGSTGGTHLNEPIVGMASTPDGGGYWLVASDGGIFSYGDSQFFGSTGGTHLNKPIVGMAALPASSVITSPGTAPSTQPSTPATTSLTVSVSELPAETNADVTVNGPDGFSETLTASTTISPATPGAWTVVADPVSAGDDTYYPLTQTTNVTLDSGAAGSVSVDYADAVANTNVVATPDALESLSGPDDNGNYTATVSDPDSVIQVGSVLTVAAGTADPNGLLLDVTSVTNTDGVDTIGGTEGSLTDIGPQADIDVSTGPLGGTDDASEAHAEGAQVTQVAHSDQDNLSDPLSCSGSVSGTVGGSVSFSPSIDFSAKWGGIFHPGTFTTSTSMSGTEQADLNAQISAAASCTYDQDIPPTPIVLAVIDVQIGPVPLVITPELDFELEASGTVEGKVEASATQTLTATAGVSWNGSSISPIASLSNSFSSQAPTVSLDGTLHAQIGPQLSFLLYGIAGPYLSADAFATLNASLNSTPWWTLTGGFEAGGGIELNIFGEKFSEGDPSILSKTWTIAQATTPAPLSVSTQSLEDATQGSSYNQSLSAQGGTAPYNWAVTSGSLPTGVSLSSSGTISGTPSGTGTSDFTVKVTDAKGATATASLSIDVEASGGGGGGAGDLSGVVSVVSGGGGYCALLNSGGVDCWGNGLFGELGDGTFYTTGSDGSATPVQVIAVGGTGTLTGVVSLSSDGNGSYCALLSGGGVDCWGYGFYGELGNGDFYTSGNDGSATPVQVVGIGGTGTLAGVAKLTGFPVYGDGGANYCAVLSGGAIDCWGSGADGELGDGNFYATGNKGSAVPVQVVGVGGTGTLTGVVSLSSDSNGSSCAVLSSGGVDCWGYGGNGELGDGNFYATGNKGSATPVQVVGVGGTGTLGGVVSVVGDEYEDDEGGYCAGLSSGGADCWGYGGGGELGDGNFYTTANYGSATPVRVVGVDGLGNLGGVESLVSDGNNGNYCAQLDSGGVDCWGYDNDGELGNGNDPDTGDESNATPVQVLGVGGTGTLGGVVSVTSDSTGSYCVGLSSGGVDCWGYGSDGELGDGDFYLYDTGNVDSPTPVQVVGVGGTGSLGGVVSLVDGIDEDYCAQLNSGSVDCWGYGADGELGDGEFYTTANYGSATPVQVVGVG